MNSELAEIANIGSHLVQGILYPLLSKYRDYRQSATWH